MSTPAVATPAISVCSTAIRQHNNFYSLNDLHRASGSARKHQPARFMRLDTTRALVGEIRYPDMGIIPVKVVRGKGKPQGTYACRELVIAYAAWISPAFHLKVIRVFLDQVGQGAQQKALPEAPHPTVLPISIDFLRKRDFRKALNTAREAERIAWREGRIFSDKLEKLANDIDKSFEPDTDGCLTCTFDRMIMSHRDAMRQQVQIVWDAVVAFAFHCNAAERLADLLATSDKYVRMRAEQEQEAQPKNDWKTTRLPNRDGTVTLRR